MVKTYTGSKGVQVTTIGVSPYTTTDVGTHNAEIVPNENILKAAPVSGRYFQKLVQGG